MNLLDIFSLIVMAIGFIIVLSAKAIVKKLNLVEKQKCQNASEMIEAEIQDYKFNTAVFKTKIAGLVILLPGLILFFINSSK